MRKAQFSMELPEVLDENKSERHIKGGMATKRKYQNLKR